MNELSEIFERLGIDTVEVLEAAGSKWNFLPSALVWLEGIALASTPIISLTRLNSLVIFPKLLAGRRMNDNMARYAARNIVKAYVSSGIDLSSSTVGILGITFKDNCPDIRNSKIIDL